MRFHVRWAPRCSNQRRAGPRRGPRAAIGARPGVRLRAPRRWSSGGGCAAEEGIRLEPPGRFPKQRDRFLCWSATRATRSSSPRDISLAGKWNPILYTRRQPAVAPHLVCFDLRCVLLLSERAPRTQRHLPGRTLLQNAFDLVFSSFDVILIVSPKLEFHNPWLPYLPISFAFVIL